MTKLSFLSFLVLIISSCAQQPRFPDYLGQKNPDSIPTIFAPGLISVKERLEHGISFAPDLKEMFFGIIHNDKYNGELFYSKRIANKWSEPKIFEPLVNKSVYLPYLSPDGKKLLYAQSRSDSDDQITDIWMLEKVNYKWTSSKLLPQAINSNARESNASMTLNGTIYFSSNRNCIGINDCYTADLFFSKRINNEYQNAEVISAFQSTNDEESVFISPKEDYIIFCRFSTDGNGTDLLISYKDIKDQWTVPELMDASINSKDWERRPFVTFDNEFLFFTRLQIDSNELIESDIYWVNTAKVFKPYIYNSLSDKTVLPGKKFKISIAKDYFRDINDQDLIYTIKADQYEWLNVDQEQMILSGNAPNDGACEIIVTATDKSNNKTVDSFVIMVKK